MLRFVNINGQVIGWKGSVFCTGQQIGWEDCLWNDLWCVEWDAKPFSTQLSTGHGCWNIPFLTSGHSGAQAGRQSALMSKITNDGLTRSGTGCFIAVPILQLGFKGLRKHSKGKHLE